jgi:hypothetical protein
VAQLYPQALGSIFVASYDSYVYGGGIRPRLHTGYLLQTQDIVSGKTQEKTPIPAVLLSLHGVTMGWDPQKTPFPAVLPMVTLYGVTYSSGPVIEVSSF